MNDRPPFAPSHEDAPQRFMATIHYLDPREPDGVKVISNIVENLVTNPSYVLVSWDDGSDVMLSIPRERVILLHVAPLRN